eukprot:11754366-Alexandrium_andersonii.AAC.1
MLSAREQGRPSPLTCTDRCATAAGIVCSSLQQFAAVCCAAAPEGLPPPSDTKKKYLRHVPQA